MVRFPNSRPPFHRIGIAGSSLLKPKSAEQLKKLDSLLPLGMIEEIAV